MVLHADCEAEGNGIMARKAKPKSEPIQFITCLECGNEQADMGRNVLCEQCDAPMPDTPPAEREGKHG